MTDNGINLARALPMKAGSAFAPAGRHRKLRRAAGSWLLVLLIHLAFLTLFIVSEQPVTLPRVAEKESILYLPPLHRESLPRLIVPSTAPSGIPPEIRTAPITLPPMIPLPLPPSADDILRAIGEALACGASSYEGLPEDERENCRHSPWAGTRMPDGVIILALPKPQLDTGMTGAEAVRHEMNTAPACPRLQNVPCLGKTIDPNLTVKIPLGP